MLRRSPLKPVSQSRRDQQTMYDHAVQRAFSRDRFRCVAAALVPDVECGGRLDPHHIKPQNRYPELRCDTANILSVCRYHHRWIGLHPIEAKELGLAAA